ncbi:hypothetical protein NP233_g11437 [Leucocoprinus birnbaumii]|uniref:Uncharacterized protein n=1 Tax=Leucocoprinus birnbaumii TaxID=56174 RepID=A0AAD5VK47_9AGAR|nr:hypothetical protein NP233_g11437 [Leucocoprinus birnbaumii]
MSLEKACTIFKLAYNLGLVGEEGRPPPPIFWPEAYVGSFNDYEVPQLSEGEHGNGHYDVFDFIGQLPGLLNDLAFAKAETMFINPNERETEIVVIVKGRHPGVAGNRIAAQNAIDADHAFIRAYMTSQLVAYNDNGTIRAHICPYY